MHYGHISHRYRDRGGGASMNGRLLRVKINIHTWEYIFEIGGWFYNTSRLCFRAVRIMLFSFIGRRFEVMLFCEHF